MATINCFEELEIWQLARFQCKSIRSLLHYLKESKEFELNSQIKRSSGSVMDNIAEGFEREGNNEFLNFLSISKGSNGEFRSQMYRAFDCEFLSEDDFNNFVLNNKLLSKKIKAFMEYLKNSEHKGLKFRR